MTSRSEGLDEALRMLAARKGRASWSDAPSGGSVFPMTSAAREALRLSRSSAKSDPLRPVKRLA